MYRVHYLQVPVHFREMFVRNQDIHSHNTRQTMHMHIPHVKTNLGKACIRYRGSVVWNHVLNLNVCIDVSEYVFSKTLKASLMGELWQL